MKQVRQNGIIYAHYVVQITEIRTILISLFMPDWQTLCDTQITNFILLPILQMRNRGSEGLSDSKELQS